MKNLITCLFLGIVISLQAQKTEIEVGNFTEVSFGVSGTLYLSQGSKNEVIIEASDEAMERIEVIQVGNNLKIRHRSNKGWNWKDWNGGNITAYVTVKDLEGVFVSGSGSVVGKNKIDCEDLDIEISGSGGVEMNVSAADVEVSISGSGRAYLEGSADEVDLSISGSGKLKGDDFVVNVLDASISGSGSAYITANKEIEARISGSGGVYYNGNPDRVSSHSSGSGKVRKM